MGKAKAPRIPPDQLPVEIRLKIPRYDPNDCKDAINGQRLPSALGCQVHRLCAIRGIRHHFGFAQELRGTHPEFTRALNARDIMSGIIPNISSPEETPYCIWHPDIPPEETLRALVQRYPDMLYHTARACAVAGYIDLYRELDSLPEIHVAEEAGYAAMQRNIKGSQEIYQQILSQPVKYAIMNDYSLTIDIPGRQIKHLNGDTAVYSSLGARFKYSKPDNTGLYDKPWDTSRQWWNSFHFNITEDWGIDDHQQTGVKAPEDYFQFIYSPLPLDLPLIDKDKLIIFAAHHGDIDRYARLRRPHMISTEPENIIHGIFHNAYFAKWWSAQIPEYPLQEEGLKTHIRRAINSRRIMSNDVSWVNAETPFHLLPENIWFPSVATPITYLRLAHANPAMFQTCLRACIVAGAHKTWNELLRSPPEGITDFRYPRAPGEPEDPKLWRLSRVVGQALLMEAKESQEKSFLDDISAAMSPDRFKRLSESPITYDTWETSFFAHGLYFPCRSPDLWIDDPVRPFAGEGPYNGVQGEVGSVDFAVFIKDAIPKEIWEKEKKEKETSLFYLDNIYNLLDNYKFTRSVKLV